jgi:hypothetical protein
MSALDFHVKHVESVSLGWRPGRANALAEADFRHWRLSDWSRPLEAQLRQFKRYRLGTTTDATPLEDGTYPENSTVFISGWTNDARQNDAGMPVDQIKRLVRTSHAYVEHQQRFLQGWVSIQHPDAPEWFREAVRAGERYKLRLSLLLVQQSLQWSLQEPRAERAKAFAFGHPLFFNLSAEFVRR